MTARVTAPLGASPRAPGGYASARLSPAHAAKVRGMIAESSVDATARALGTSETTLHLALTVGVRTVTRDRLALAVEGRP